MKARSSVKFMDVYNVKVTDEDGVLARSVMTNAKNTIGKERLVFRPSHPDTGALSHDERVISSSSASKMCVMKCGHFGNFPVVGASKSSRR